MIFRIQILLIAFFIYYPIKSQEVISSSGVNISNSSFNINCTVGEAIIITGASSTNFVTQGFNQPNQCLLTLFVDAGPDSSICFGDSIILNASGFMSYNWSNSITNGEPFIPTNSSMYYLTATDSSGCSAYDSVEITVLSNPIINSSVSAVITGNDGSIDISISNGTPPYYYDWNIDGNGDFDDSQDLYSLDIGTYQIIVIDSLGCKDTLIINLEMDNEIYVHPVITPNGDGINEIWNINGLNENSKVTVINRWGQILYENIGNQSQWDGTYNNELLPASDYYYIIDIQSGSGQVYTGTITIKY